MYVIQDTPFKTIKLLRSHLKKIKQENQFFAPVVQTEFLKQAFQKFGVDTSRVSTFKVVPQGIEVKGVFLTVRVFAGFTAGGVRLSKEFSVSALRHKDYA